MIAIVIGVLLVTAAAIAAIYRTQADPARAEGLEGAWAQALEHENSPVARMLLSVSRPVTHLPQVHLRRESSLYKSLRIKLAAAGALYGGSVEVFVSVQVMAALLAAGAMLSAVLLQLGGMQLGAVALIAFAVAGTPYSRVNAEAKKRAEEVAAGLPEFAELLLMPISSGYGIRPALGFTAKRLTGPVAAEVRLMLQILDSHAASEQEAFIGAGERLGSSAAVTFFNTLYQSVTEGVRISDNIRAQAEQLRKQSFERTRAKIKGLPNRLVIIMGMHLMPFLFVVVLMPTMVALGSAK